MKKINFRYTRVITPVKISQVSWGSPSPLYLCCSDFKLNRA